MNPHDATEQAYKNGFADGYRKACEEGRKPKGSAEVLIPDCCRGCDNLDAVTGCTGKQRRCARWLEWFRQEWRDIRKSAGLDN